MESNRSPRGSANAGTARRSSLDRSMDRAPANRAINRLIPAVTSTACPAVISRQL